jgi:transposase
LLASSRTGKRRGTEMTEQEELLKNYQQEVEKCWKLAQKLDALNPELAGDFTGTPSERIEQQLYALGILK